LKKSEKSKAPKILIMDIETAPIIGMVWGLYDNNLAVNQITSDWYVLSWAAKWLDEKKVYQQDQRKSKNKSNDKQLMQGIWKLLDEADIVVGQNSKQFDVKKLNARFIIHGMKPPSSFQQIDTKLLAKKNFAFTSNGLEYMSDKLNKKYKKLKHKNFPGMELWTECLKNNQKAWKAMAEYNVFDVLATEELYKVLAPWGTGINHNVYYGDSGAKCTCGSTEFVKNGYAYTAAGKYQRFQCKSCGSELKSSQNTIKKEKRKKLLRGVVR
jgi:hypothetical protein